MAYETKVILIGMAEHIKVLKKDAGTDEKALKSLKDMYNYVSKIANVEGVVVKPFDGE